MTASFGRLQKGHFRRRRAGRESRDQCRVPLLPGDGGRRVVHYERVVGPGQHRVYWHAAPQVVVRLSGRKVAQYLGALVEVPLERVVLARHRPRNLFRDQAAVLAALGRRGVVLFLRRHFVSCA